VGKVLPAGALTVFGLWCGIWWPAYVVATLTVLVLVLETLSFVADWVPRFRKKLRRMRR
jgi:hypothetical protein